VGKGVGCERRQPLGVRQGFGTQWVEVELDTEASGFHLTCLQKACKIPEYILWAIYSRYTAQKLPKFSRFF
jgi:hypothetical protein